MVLGGVLAFSACDRAAILTVCKPFEHCLNTPQPPFHPTHTREPNNTSKLPPIAPPPPPAAPWSRRADVRGNLLMVHVSINRSSDARSASLRAANAASRLNLLKSFFFHVIEFSEVVNKRSASIHQLREWMRWVQSHARCVTMQCINDGPLT